MNFLSIYYSTRLWNVIGLVTNYFNPTPFLPFSFVPHEVFMLLAVEIAASTTSLQFQSTSTWPPASRNNIVNLQELLSDPTWLIQRIQ